MHKRVTSQDFVKWLNLFYSFWLNIKMSQMLYANLAPLIRTGSAPIAQYLVSAVARHDCDLLLLQRDLESEGIEWSNKKIVKVTTSIKNLIFKYSKANEEQKAEFKDQLVKSCIQTK